VKVIRKVAGKMVRMKVRCARNDSTSARGDISDIVVVIVPYSHSTRGEAPLQTILIGYPYRISRGVRTDGCVWGAVRKSRLAILYAWPNVNKSQG